MLIKLQEKKGYLNIKNIKRMTIAEENILSCSRVGFEGILVYYIINVSYKHLRAQETHTVIAYAVLGL